MSAIVTVQTNTTENTVIIHVPWTCTPWFNRKQLYGCAVASLLKLPHRGNSETVM